MTTTSITITITLYSLDDSLALDLLAKGEPSSHRLTLAGLADELAAHANDVLEDNHLDGAIGARTDR
jgi:hypothetical protein